ncbi:hypothetical protein HHK36_027867 [Tetracentron sinense]|uniref:Uncharacterized protein n=1 Tax=Tetracentron sinense TaxID=13715 RepID=A0A835D1L9_TETSI|nr:hypothetical protein HHK36_027867 [Tetracentron sinense]
MAGNDLRARLLVPEQLEDPKGEVEVTVDIDDDGCSHYNHHGPTLVENQNPFEFLGAGSFSVPPPSPIDPFRNHTPNIEGVYEWMKIFVCIPIAIVRLIFFGLSLVVGYIATKIALLGWKDKHNPMPKWRFMGDYCPNCLPKPVVGYTDGTSSH